MRLRPFTFGGALVAGGIGVLLYFAHAAFVPIALALLFALVLSGPVEALHRLKVPRALSAALLMLIVLALLSGAIAALWTPAQQWFAEAPKVVKLVSQKFTPVTRFAHRLDTLGSSAGNIGTALSAGAKRPPPAPVSAGESTSLLFLDATRLALVRFVAFLIVTLFLLAGGPPMMARMTAAFVDDLNSARVLSLINKVRAEVGRFYVTTGMINVGLGCATGVAMAFCGMPSPYLWGALAATLNFIPYAGSAITLIVITLVAFVTFDSLAHVAAAAGCYVGLAAIEGQIVQPLLVGRRLEVNPLLVFLALWFGGLFWGIPGIVFATPVLVALKVVAENSEHGRALTEFLGPNDNVLESKKPLGKLMKVVGEVRKQRPLRADRKERR